MRCATFLLLLASGCVCVTSPPPSKCEPCGIRMQVFTTREPGETLTRAECEKACAPAWCDAKPMGDGPGCQLLSSTELLCGPVASDCGHTFPVPCGPANCTGCCLYDGRCVQDRGPCGGKACVDCTTDPRCNTTDCAKLEACGAALPGMPRWSTCDGVDGGFRRPLDAVQDCVNACAESDAGSTLACAGALTTCDDAGVGFAARCVADAGALSSCAIDCADTRLRCEQACPLTSSEACAPCARACARDFSGCLGDCP